MGNQITFSNILDIVKDEVYDDYKSHSGHTDFTVSVKLLECKKYTVIELDMGSTTIIKPVQILYNFSAVVLDEGKTLHYEPQFYVFKLDHNGFKLNPKFGGDLDD